MDIMMIERLRTLRCLGINRALFKVIENLGVPVEPGSLLFPILNSAAQNGVPSAEYSKLLMLDVACAEWVRRELPLNLDLQMLCTPSVAPAKASGKLAEIIAGGLLGAVFPTMERIPERKKAQTPDFRLGESIFAEVYCPQESATETAKYNEWVNQNIGPIKVFVSYPLTGSSPLALKYSSNVIIDRAVSGKRDSNQFEAGSENLLWLDLLNGFGASSRDTKPYTSVHNGESTFVKSFGVWHSLYGQQGSSFVHERTDLRYFEQRNIYKQQREGLFRSRHEISGALILLDDGIVLFENPWASTPLSETARKNLKRLTRFKPDMSWFVTPGHPLEDRVDAVLAEIDWLYANPEA
ncbi:hypothetical protein [Azotobacter chroococcum]|uniref:hypothetical protein n=1 Tax=Azotobacter chroococcum TaxID=353 RepID=UPI001187284C|nr:hypothetical protein [Azotobacter chroococcum]